MQIPPIQLARTTHCNVIPPYRISLLYKQKPVVEDIFEQTVRTHMARDYFTILLSQ